jgi:hypothetical protein
MNMDKAPADSVAFGYAGGGDAGRERVEHRSFRHVEFTQSVRNSLSGKTTQRQGPPLQSSLQFAPRQRLLSG